MGTQGYEVEIRALPSAATAARSAADRVQGAIPGAVLTTAAAGIPGAAAVTVLDAVAARWRDEVTAWTGAAQAYARALDTSAEAYRHSESLAQDDVRAIADALDGAGSRRS